MMVPPSVFTDIVSFEQYIEQVDVVTWIVAICVNRRPLINRKVLRRPLKAVVESQLESFAGQAIKIEIVSGLVIVHLTVSL